MSRVAQAVWSEAALGEALLAVARQAGLAPTQAHGAVPAGAPETHGVEAWLEATADYLGLGVQAVECRCAELHAVLVRLGPALLRLDGPQGPRYLAILRSRRRHTTVVAPGDRRVRLRTVELRQALTAELERHANPRVESWIAAARLPTAAAERARPPLRDFLLSELPIGNLWLIEADPGSSLRSQLRRRGSLQRAAAFLAASCAQVAISLLGWGALGRIALSGVVDPGWLAAWVLCLLCTVPLQVMSGWLGGHVLLELAVLLKRRLLCGALRLDVDRIRSLGSGHLLAKVSESEAVESVGLLAGMNAFSALIQMAGAAVLLELGAGGAFHVLELVAWCGVVGGAVAAFARSRAGWTQQRFALAHSFLENVLGHRTRAVQQRCEDWHTLEDEKLVEYLRSSCEMDVRETRLQALAAHGWLIVALVGLVPIALDPAHGAAELALAVGGILQAHGAFRIAVSSAAALCRGALAWRSVDELSTAAASRPPAGLPELALRLQTRVPVDAPRDEAAVLLDARGVSYRYAGRAQDALNGCSLRLGGGERLLLEGSSGGGKSTLAALLAGLREPQTGRVLFRALDRSVLGAAGWRRCVASAPQFHENHILAGSLAFNLLLGRRWPAAAEDLAEAHEVCAELGLAPLIRKMPAGIHQVIGESGWSLSHGERSRVFLARALLQGAAVLVLDETFGALDPVTVQSCMETVLKRAPTLIVIAHP